MPAIQASRSTVQTSLKIEERGATAPLGRASSLLVIGEVAVAVLLVIVAGLLIRSFTGLLRVDPGFRTERIVTARVTPPAARYRTDGEHARLLRFAARARRGAAGRAVGRSRSAICRSRAASGGFAFEVEGTPYVQGEGRADDGRAQRDAGISARDGDSAAEGQAADRARIARRRRASR